MTHTKTKNISVKHKERRSLSFRVLSLLLVAMLLRYYFPIFFNTENSIFRYFSPLLSVCVCAIELLFLIVYNIKISYKALGLFLATFVCTAISIVLNTSGVEHAFGLFSILVGMYTMHADPMRGAEKDIAAHLFAVAVLLVIVNGVTGWGYSGVLGKFNPNACGFMLTMLYCVCITRFLRMHSRVDFFLAVICFILQFFYISRTALLGVIFFTLCVLICRAWRKNSFSNRTVFWVILCFSVFGILLAYFYSEILFPAFDHGNVSILGKDLFTGRQTIWHFAFDSIREHFWFGVGSHLNEAQYEAGYYEAIMNAHNQPLGTLAYYGIFTFAGFYISFSCMAADPYNKKKEGKISSRLPAIFLLMVTVTSYFEISFLSSYTWIGILIAYGLIFSYSVSSVNK